MRSAIAYLSTANLLNNLQAIKSMTNRAKCIAMVKANAYGHGLRSTALRLQRELDFLGVAAIDEALQLRKVGVIIPIILMEGIFEIEELTIAAKENFPIVFHSHEQLNWLLECYSKKLIKNPLQIWIKIDTGMGRLGFNVAEGLQVYSLVKSLDIIAKPIGIMSHFACADQIDTELNYMQIHTFNDFIANPIFNQEHIIKSICNSAAIINFPACHYDLVRPGLALYGVSPIVNKMAIDFKLKPVMTLTTKIIAIKQLARNSSIGYGSRFICPKDLKVAIIAIGYGDGYPRTAVDGTPVLINDQRCSIVGRISMDMAVVDLSNCLTAQVGDQVILWGNNLPIEEVVKYTQNSVYDLLTAVQHRVKFIWQDN